MSTDPSNPEQNLAPKDWPGDYGVLGRVLDLLAATTLELHELGRGKLAETLMANLERHLSAEPAGTFGLGRTMSVSLSVRAIMAEREQKWESVAELSRRELSIPNATSSTVYLATVSLGKALQHLGQHSAAAAAYVEALMRTGNVPHVSETAGLLIALGWLVDRAPETASSVSDAMTHWCKKYASELVSGLPAEAGRLATMLREMGYTMWPDSRESGLDGPAENT